MINALLKMNEKSSNENFNNDHIIIEDSLNNLIINHRDYIENQKLLFMNLNETKDNFGYEILKNKDKYINNNFKSITQHFKIFYAEYLIENSNLESKIKILENAIKNKDLMIYYYYFLDEIYFDSIDLPKKDYFENYIKNGNKSLHFWMLDKDKMKKKFENDKKILIKQGTYTVEEIVKFYTDKYKPEIKNHYNMIKNKINFLDKIKIKDNNELKRKEEVFMIFKNYIHIQLHAYLNSYCIFDRIINLIFQNLVRG